MPEKFRIPNNSVPRNLFLLLFFLAIAGTPFAQPRMQPTHIPDTSFSTARDFRQNVKKYPFIRVVPDSPSVSVQEARDLAYCTIGPRTLHIDAFWTRARKKLPTVLIVHGGGWRSGSRSQHIPLAQRLAAHGYACFTIEYRLSTEALYPAGMNDIVSAMRWMRANAGRFNLDTANVAILGFSAGGQMAALAGATSNTNLFNGNECNRERSAKVQAVIDIDGTLSFIHPDAWETQNQEKLNASAYWLGYPRTSHLELWTEASPLSHGSDNTAPFLFLNSAVTRMQAGQKDFIRLMQGKGVYTQAIDFGDTPHAFCLYDPWFSEVVKDVDVFLKQVFH